jgi:hypothetical protein
MKFNSNIDDIEKALILLVSSDTDREKTKLKKMLLAAARNNQEACDKILLWNGGTNYDVFEVQSFIVSSYTEKVNTPNLPNIEFYNNVDNFILSIKENLLLNDSEKRIILSILRHAWGEISLKTRIYALNLLKNNLNEEFRFSLPHGLLWEFDCLFFLSFSTDEVYIFDDNITLLHNEGIKVSFLILQGNIHVNDDFKKRLLEASLQVNSDAVYLWTSGVAYVNELRTFSDANNIGYSYTGYDSSVKEKIQNCVVQQLEITVDNINMPTEFNTKNYPFFIGGGLAEKDAYSTYPLWPHRVFPDNGKIVPLKFVGKVKDDEETLYLFYSSPGLEDEDADYSLINGLNAVVTSSSVSPGVEMLPLNDFEKLKELVWSPVADSFMYKKTKKDVKFYTESVVFLSKEYKIPELELKIIIPSGVNGRESFFRRRGIFNGFER